MRVCFCFWGFGFDLCLVPSWFLILWGVCVLCLPGLRLVGVFGLFGWTSVVFGVFLGLGGSSCSCGWLLIVVGFAMDIALWVLVCVAVGFWCG